MEYENDTTWLNAMLCPGEHILWSARPGKAPFLQGPDWLMIPISIFLIAFAFYWQKLTLDMGAPRFARIWGLLVIIMSLYSTLGRVFILRHRNKLSRYALTNRRIIVKIGKASKSLDLVSLPQMSVTQRGDDIGDIRFGESSGSVFKSDFGFKGPFTDTAVLELKNVPQVNRTAQLIRDAAAQAEEERHPAD